MNQNQPGKLPTKQNVTAGLGGSNEQSNQDRFDKLLTFLRQLEDAKISHQLADYREGAVSVVVRGPGEYWEVDFLEDGEVEVERFRSNGHIDHESVLAELFALCSDDEAPASHDAAPRP